MTGFKNQLTAIERDRLTVCGCELDVPLPGSCRPIGLIFCQLQLGVVLVAGLCDVARRLDLLGARLVAPNSHLSPVRFPDGRALT